MSRWADLGPRALSALVLGPVALGCVWAGGPAYAVLILAAGAVLAFEWAGLCGARAPAVATSVAAMALAIGLAYWWGLGAGTAWLLATAALSGIATRRLLPGAGPLYLGLPMLALLWLRLQPDGRWAVLFLLLVVWATDIGAYALGRWLRGPKLAPRISPGKTWAGAAGGVIGAAVVAAAMARGVWLALLLSAVCQAGDLLESGIKRHVGVKDSGRLIPGHGGLLDRVDGLLAAALTLALVQLADRGGGI